MTKEEYKKKIKTAIKFGDTKKIQTTIKEYFKWKREKTDDDIQEIFGDIL